MNSVTHEPIARALVSISGESPDAQLTDNEGRFDFQNALAGRCTLQARRPGFFGTASGRDLYMNIAVGPNSRDHVLALEPAGSITGQITTPASDTGNTIRVQLLRRNIQEGRAHWQPSETKLTNSEGAFRFGNLRPGEYKLYTISSIDPDVTSSQAPVRWGFPSVSYPEEGESSTTGFLRVAPGQQLNAQLALTREPFYSVTIPVANTDIQGYSIQVSDVRGPLNDAGIFYDQRQQQFRAYLPNGNYAVTIQSPAPSPGYASIAITVRNAPLHIQSLAILPIHPIPVTIHKEFASSNNNGQQIVQIENGKQVEISQDVNLMLVSATDEGMMGVGLRHEPEGDDSSWVLDNVPPGKYWVQTYATQGYVASISAGGTDLTRDPLVIGPGGASAPIQVVLRNDMSTISVRVKNAPQSALDAGSPTGASMHPSFENTSGYLYLLPQFDTSSVIPQAMPLQQSAITFVIQPGTYRVLALDRPIDLEYRSTSAIEAYIGKVQTITVEPNGTTNLDVDVISTEAAAQ